jgi:hypothetical protein
VIIGVDCFGFFGNFSFAQELMLGKVGMISIFLLCFWHGGLVLPLGYLLIRLV